MSPATVNLKLVKPTRSTDTLTMCNLAVDSSRKYAQRRLRLYGSGTKVGSRHKYAYLEYTSCGCDCGDDCGGEGDDCEGGGGGCGDDCGGGGCGGEGGGGDDANAADLVSVIAESLFIGVESVFAGTESSFVGIGFSWWILRRGLMGQTLAPEINLGFDLRVTHAKPKSDFATKTRNGAPRIRTQNAACVQRILNIETKDSDSALKIRRDAFVAKFKLLQEAQTRPIVMPIEEAMQWRDLVVDLGACLYNEHSACSSYDAASTIMTAAFDTVSPMLVQRIPQKDMWPGATMHLQRLLHRCFWSGTLLQAQTTLRFMPLIPCDFPDIRNVVAVHCALRRAVPFQRIETELPKSGTSLLRIKETNGECLLLNDEFDVRNVRPEHFNAAPSPNQETVVLSDTQIKPRASVLGWIARVYVYLVDKYGRDAVGRNFVSDVQVLEWVGFTRSSQEMYFEQVAAHLTGDYNPLVLLSRKDRVKYARTVLTERKEHASSSSSRNIPIVNASSSADYDFEWTVTSMYQAEVAELVHTETNETRIVVVGDPNNDASIAESIQAFMEDNIDDNDNDDEALP